MNRPSEEKLEFYTAGPLTGEGEEPAAIQRGLTLPRAIAAFNSGAASAIGAAQAGRDVELVQRWMEKPLLITDYQQDAHWRYNAELSVSAVNMLITTLGIRYQSDGGAIHRLARRIHILQLRGGDATRHLRWQTLGELEKNGNQVEMRNYALADSEPVYENETFEHVFWRLNIEPRPKTHIGHALSVSDVLALQSRKGCIAYYLDRTGPVLLPRFVRPPGEAARAQEARKEAAER
ncbi:MAG TPA: hypothetical protein IAA52_07840 [Candidatus Pullichristensenella stercorigallinarum]|uniref:YodL-like domain-containing protein n=1 Tax=Candidatus Pullichristensenella stercorigallinarum TaxID=2840909 RepID=A0A9D1CXZ0_9FIRM|nr:hypothetical protein [Candidatus Pullichristensenella stercorigallinarum]